MPDEFMDFEYRTLRTTQAASRALIWREMGLPGEPIDPIRPTSGDDSCHRRPCTTPDAGDLLTTVDTSPILAPVSRNTMSFALPESMREYIDMRVRDGNYGNTSEYLRELVRRDQEQQAAQRLRDLIADGLASGEGRQLTDDVIAELRVRALDGDA